MGRKLVLKKFNPYSIKVGRRILMIGRSGSGKSSLVEDIVECIRDRYQYMIGYTPTKDSVNMFRKMMPDSVIHDTGFDREHFASMIESLNELDDQGKKRNLLILLDDCMYDPTILKSPEMNKACMNGRHWGCGMINCVQYLMAIPPAIREQQDYVFALGNKTHSIKKKLHEYFFGVFPTLKSFIKVFDWATKDFGCLVIDNTIQSSNIEETIFWYRATLGKPDLMIPSKTLHWFHRQYYVPLEDRKKLKDPDNKNVLGEKQAPGAGFSVEAEDEEDESESFGGGGGKKGGPVKKRVGPSGGRKRPTPGPSSKKKRQPFDLDMSPEFV